MSTVPIKPYLMRAIHEWCSDQGFTPYLVVAVKGKMQVPMEFVKNGEIVLNISYNATRNLHLGDDYVRFSARFNGVSRDIIVPVGAVVSLFARESGEGMAWEPEPGDGMVEEAKVSPLRAVATDEPETLPTPAAEPVAPPPEDEPPPTGGRPRLRVVK
ncbi:ClpXP protease specificity-enhancing factor [Chitinimonas lacunae]|uniref:ClpXP protease specificity-enhancing factor n=1 Tax=Chitinimonas lacunae TaxID=1963018 RepID=A0ABV8MPF3_9NEIS